MALRMKAWSAVALAFGTLMTAGSASAATPAGPVARSGAVTVAADGVQPLASVHSCKVAGNSGTIQGVFCADIVDQGGGDFLVQTQAVCQDTRTSPATPLQCADITYPFAGASENFGVFLLVDNAHWCGHEAGPCPTPRLILALPFHVDKCDHVWTVVKAGAQIRLPGSGKVVALTSDFGSGHAPVLC